MSGDQQLLQRGLVRQRRVRAVREGHGHFLLDEAARDIAERVGEVNRQFARVLDLSARPGAVARHLASAPRHLASAPRHLARTADGPPPDEGGIGVTSVLSEAIPGVSRQVVLDEEALPFAAQSFDLAVSALALHAVNDLPGALIQINAALKPDGLFVASLFGGDTLCELRQSFAAAESEILGGVSPRVTPFTTLADAGRLLQRAGFTLPVADSDRLTVRYATSLELMRDLRHMGETNALNERERRPLSRRLLQAVIEHYDRHYRDADGRVRATFEILTMTGWRAHKDQQKPLAPGSARMRLADALKTKEVPAGDAARPGGPIFTESRLAQSPREGSRRAGSREGSGE